MSKHVFIVSVAFFIISGIAVGATFFFVFDALRSENLALNRKIQTLGNQIALVESSIGVITGRNEEVEGSIKKLKEDFTAEKTQDDLLTEAVEKVTGSVVSVIVSKTTSKLEIVYVNPFGDDPAFKDVNARVPVYKQSEASSKQIAAGSGFIVRSNGYIVTNSHVIDFADAVITVLMSNGKQEQASVVYKDELHDIAIIKVNSKNLSAVSFGDSDKIKLGQTVIAIGNALGTYSNSVSTGIVSGLHREILADSKQGALKLQNVIQTDAAINKGNSGGPLISLDGKVVGMNVATSTSGEGIGFSIPSKIVKEIIDNNI